MFRRTGFRIRMQRSGARQRAKKRAKKGRHAFREMRYEIDFLPDGKGGMDPVYWRGSSKRGERVIRRGE